MRLVQPWVKPHQGPRRMSTFGAKRSLDRPGLNDCL